ncbi:hypothetical protein RHO15_09710 [Utexia brackfieldae]|uniref:hypothetical protein n=1 Tax=Utexia brackfieldae TaxID=3074108 RepID=UPI00370DC20E
MTLRQITPNSQLYRVVSIASRGMYTLNEIQSFIHEEFNVHDQETSISARLRQAENEFGYEKSKTRFVNPKTGRVHFRYTLIKQKSH